MSHTKTFVVLLAFVACGCEERSRPSSSAPTQKPPPPSVQVNTAASLIPYSVITQTGIGTAKASYDVRVPLVEQRLPKAEELSAISIHLRSLGAGRERTFVSFYLPGMEPRSGAFATAHHNPNLEVQLQHYMLPDEYRSLHDIAVVAPSNEAAQEREEPSPIAPAPDLGGSRLLLHARAISADTVEFTIWTDIPLPIEVMAGVQVKDQDPDGVWIGDNRKVFVESSPQMFSFKPARPLPRGSYEAKVFYNYRYAKNPDAAVVKGPFESKADLGEFGAGLSASAFAKRKEAQRWLMENVISGTAWNEATFVKRFGPSERIESSMAQHEAVYFPEADVTLLVNVNTRKVTVWRLGRASR